MHRPDTRRPDTRGPDTRGSDIRGPGIRASVRLEHVVGWLLSLALLLGAGWISQTSDHRAVRAAAASSLRDAAWQAAGIAGSPVELASAIEDWNRNAPAGVRSAYRIDAIVAAPETSASTTRASWRVVAIPRSDGPFAGDPCGTLGLDESGRRSVTGNKGVAYCWHR